MYQVRLATNSEVLKEIPASNITEINKAKESGFIVRWIAVYYD